MLRFPRTIDDILSVKSTIIERVANWSFGFFRCW
uniref:Uncharacterized protein n=1 Tax=Rhizophora mucronata TaxID=61149 RepID=A0A2P2IS25_RHIMU